MAVVVDYPGTGEMLTEQGAIPVLTDQDALVNAINLWICSFRGERLYSPYAGGIVADNLVKPMSSQRAQDMQKQLADSLRYEFNPAISVKECTVVPDFIGNTYWITVRGYCPGLKSSIYSKIGIKPLV